MAWIRMISEEEASGDLKSLYETYQAPWGSVDNVLKIHSASPKTLKPHMDLYRTIMFAPSPLTRPQREMIGLVVSATNGCHYCVNHHGDALYRLTKNKTLVKQLRSDYHEAGISDQEKLMLEFSVALTSKPQENHRIFIERLKSNDFTDEGIHDVVAITSYFNFVNRIVQGLGVDLEHYWDDQGFSNPDLPMAHDRRGE